MAAEVGLKAQKLLAQGVLAVTYDTPSFWLTAIDNNYVHNSLYFKLINF